MKDLQLQEIYVYPIKSLGGISLQESEVQQRGLKYDRRWMLTDLEGNFISQRTHPQLALLQTSILPDGLKINHKRNKFSPLFIPFDATGTNELMVNIWADSCTALEVDIAVSEWFSYALDLPVRLVFMHETTRRLVDTNYASSKEIVSFADAYPFLIIGQSSLDDLNNLLEYPVPMNRFRPNFVFTGGVPYLEDSIHSFCIEISLLLL